MNRTRIETIADVIAIIVAIWFLLSDQFADFPAKNAVSAIAVAVICYSLVRIFLRWRKGQ